MTVVDDIVAALEEHDRRFQNGLSSMKGAIAIIKSRAWPEAEFDSSTIDALIDSLQDGCRNCKAGGPDGEVFDACERHDAMWELRDAIVAAESEGCQTGHQIIPGVPWASFRIDNDAIAPTIYRNPTGEIGTYKSRAIRNCPDCGNRLSREGK